MVPPLFLAQSDANIHSTRTPSRSVPSPHTPNQPYPQTHPNHVIPNIHASRAPVAPPGECPWNNKPILYTMYTRWKTRFFAFPPFPSPHTSKPTTSSIHNPCCGLRMLTVVFLHEHFKDFCLNLYLLCLSLKVICKGISQNLWKVVSSC